MRPHRWPLPLVLIGALLITLAPNAPAGPAALAAPIRNNILTVDQFADEADLPADLLSEEEVARIEQLQGDAAAPLAISGVSPDDGALLISSAAELAFLEIASGATTPIDPEAFGPLVPLPLLGFSDFSWLDERTLGALALNFLAESEADALAVVRIDRFSGEISGRPLAVPADVGLVSVAPSLTRVLIVRDPAATAEGPAAAGRFTTPLTLGPQAPAAERSGRITLPAALQRRADLARTARAATLARVSLLRDDEDPTAETDVTALPLDLFTYDLASGAERYVTSIPAASALLGDTWSADSGRLAVSFFGVADAEGRGFYSGSLLSEEIYQDVTGNLPPGRSPIVQNNNTYIVELGDGRVQLIRPDAAAGAPLLAAHDWAPGGRSLLIKAYHPAYLKGRSQPIYYPRFSARTSFRFYDSGADGRLAQRQTFEHPMLAGGDVAFAFSAADFVSPDEIIVRGVTGSNRHPYYYNRVSGELRNLADRAGAYYNVYATSGATRQIIFTHTSYSRPPDIYRVRWDGSALARLTWANEELRLAANLREDPVSFTLPGGQVRVGTLIQAAGAAFPPRNVPLVVWQEGGPNVPMINQWQANVENPYALLPSFGFALLVTPLAGRHGYTPAVYNALVDGAAFGQIDIDEQATIVRQAIARGWTSRGRVGITGCSYGGYFTLQSVVRHPDLYAAANPQCGFIDLISDWKLGGGPLVPYMEGLPPYNALAEYRADSPSYGAGQVRAAVLTFHGVDDYLPIVQNENFHLQLVARGVPARMVRFAYEGHGLGLAANQRYAAQEQISWFRTYLK